MLEGEVELEVELEVVNVALDQCLPYKLQELEVPGLESSQNPTTLLHNFGKYMLDVVCEGTIVIHDDSLVSKALLDIFRSGCLRSCCFPFTNYRLH